jgi:hypothetical protein
VPTSELDIYNNADFGFTWSKFFMKSANEDKIIEISTDSDILVRTDGIDRIKIGRINPDASGISDNYGMQVKNADGDLIF